MMCGARSIGRVVHDKTNPRLITHMLALMGSDIESIPLSKPVSADGNIEVWLRSLERGMQQTMRDLTAEAAAVAGTLLLPTLLESHCAQLALLSLQLAWTASVTLALDRAKTIKTAISDCTRRQMVNLAELSGMCLTVRARLCPWVAAFSVACAACLVVCVCGVSICCLLTRACGRSCALAW